LSNIPKEEKMLDPNSSLKLDRREFLRIIGAGAALTGVGAILQACAPAPTPTAVPTPVPPTAAPTVTPPMYARVTVTMSKLDKFDEGGPLWRERVLPNLLKAEGFRGVLVLNDRKTGKGYTITLWTTEAAMKALETSGAYTQAVSVFKDFFTAPPTMELYEVFLQA